MRHNGRFGHFFFQSTADMNPVKRVGGAGQQKFGKSKKQSKNFLKVTFWNSGPGFYWANNEQSGLSWVSKDQEQ